MFYDRKKVIQAINETKMALLKELLLEQKIISLSVNGNSMLPNIHPGEEIFISAVTTPDEISINDILLFYDYEYFFVLHRLLKITGQYFVLKGDNAHCMDHIKFNHILGKQIDSKTHSTASIVKKRKVSGYTVEINLIQGKLAGCQVYKE